ncbi:MAG: TetR/AcrR family transcriptional regulator [Bacteroidota bacterium]
MSPTLSDRKEDVAEAILDAAMKLFVEKGVDKTSMRNIAGSIGYSAGNVYLYFKNKAEILHTLHSRGFQKMRSSFDVLRMVSDPLERMKAMGKAYLAFAAENPQLYNLMFVSMAPMKHLDADCSENWTEGATTFMTLKNTVEECKQLGYFAGHDIEHMSFMVWSTVHGMASLSNAQRINRVKFENPDQVLEKGYEEFCLMLDRLK